MRFHMQPGGRLLVQGVPARFLVSRAFNTNNSEMLVGGPGAANTDRYDIVAKSPVEVAQGDQEALAPMLLSLLVDRFKMKYHTEERPVSTYALVAAKPKMKKADPESRSSCKSGNAPAGAPQGSRVLTCQNVTMAQFADRLQNLAPGLSWPVPDATGIEGGWDFSLTYSMGSMMPMAFAARQVGGPDPGPGGAAVPAASEPVGGNTIFEAVEKQLGLKLETTKGPIETLVIEHAEKPSAN